MVRFVLACLLGLVAQTAAAQESEARFFIGDDAYLSGQTVIYRESGSHNVFAAAQRLRLDADASGTVHAAAQSIDLNGQTGGNAYLLAQDVVIGGDVAGDVSVAAQTVRIDGTVGGALRAAGERIEVNAPVAGYAMIGGQSVTIAAPIAGDVELGAERVIFADGARIDGTLTLYEEEPGETRVPASVIAEARVTRVDASDWEGSPAQVVQVLPRPRDLILRFLGGVLMVAFLAAVIAALIPERLARMRALILDRPFRTLGVGFVAESALIGSIFVVAMTLIGILLIPAILIVAWLAALAGYVVGAYGFGVGLVQLVGREVPHDLAERAVAAGIGALVAGLIAMVPIVGWIFALALSLTGLGGIVGEVWGRRMG